MHVRPRANQGMCRSNECGARFNLRRMDRFLSMSMLVWRLGVSRHEEHPEPHIRESAMTRSMQASLTAIGRQLHDDYQPTVEKPLPTELKDLVARLIALEINKRGTSRRAIAVLQARAAQPEPKA